MKRIIVLLVITIFLLTSCAELVEMERTVVTATVVDKTYTRRRVVTTGKSTIIRRARYITNIEYDDISMSVNNKEVYDNYEVGDDIEVYLVVKEYDDGEIQKTLKLIEEN